MRATYKRMRRAAGIGSYVLSGRTPWSRGYAAYKTDFIGKVLGNDDLMARFRQNQELPAGYGRRLDERVAEYPWVISRLSRQARFLLDAGSALNHELLLAMPILQNKSIVIYTLSPEHVISRSNISYIYGDLRATMLRDQTFEEIVCISTLEHVGLDNTIIYTRDQSYNEAQLFDYRAAIQELRRLLKPGGRLFLTVPYGRYQNLGWLQQFNKAGLDDIIRTFDGDLIDQAFYRYAAEGWLLAEQEACDNSEYHDVHTSSSFALDHAAAARAVACLELSC